LKTDGDRILASMGNYVSLSRATAVTADEAIVDLFSYHPADYAIVGGCWCVKDGHAVHTNVVLAGCNAMAVDAVGAAILGRKPDRLGLMKLAWKRGFGIYDIDSIW